jgi:hypothetical protein
VLAVGDGRDSTFVNNKIETTGFIHFFDVASGKEVRQFSCPGGIVRALAFSPDGGTLAACHITYNDAGAATKCVLMLWEVATGRERARLMELEQHQGLLSVLFSPDGRTLASSGPDNKVHLWEVATGRERHRLEGHRGRVTSLSFSADGNRLISGSNDTSVLIWDLTRVLKDKPRGAIGLSPKDLEALWSDLGGRDAARAYQAQAKLIAAPKETLAFLKERLPSSAEPDLRGVPALLADLDADDFAAREKAIEGLEKLGPAAEFALRKALKGQLSAEVQRQVERLLERLRTQPLLPERLQTLRALEVLERLDTPESRHLLKELAEGAAGAWLTQEAKAINDRLAARQQESP